MIANLFRIKVTTASTLGYQAQPSWATEASKRWPIPNPIASGLYHRPRPWLRTLHQAIASFSRWYPDHNMALECLCREFMALGGCARASPASHPRLEKILLADGAALGRCLLVDMVPTSPSRIKAKKVAQPLRLIIGLGLPVSPTCNKRAATRSVTARTSPQQSGKRQTPNTPHHKERASW